MLPGDTIVALSSAPGRSARAIVRLSGAGTREILSAVLDGPARPFDRGCFASRLRIGPGLPVLVSMFRAPASYTGEDSAELVLPGNPALADRVLTLITDQPGSRLAGPGEFSARAYLNEKLTLEQAEGIAATIAAQTREQLDAAADLVAGRSGYRRWADELTTLLALVEAGIDFTDQEDVVPIAPGALASRIERLVAEIEEQLGGKAAAEAPGHLARVVLAGRPNAGKSTLFNALLGRERAVVSPVAGTTRDALEEELDLGREQPGASSVLLADLAGLDEAATGTGSLAQRAAVEGLSRADVVIHCDPDGRFDPLGTSKPVIRVRTKADLPGVVDDSDRPIAVCALDGWNLNVLRRAIVDAATGTRGAGLSAVLPRHRRALIDTRRALMVAGLSLDPAAGHLADPELVAGSLREALDAIGALVGRISPDDVIGRVFATFCVGK